jgi:multiple sugar transport system substrate-binding protein
MDSRKTLGRRSLLKWSAVLGLGAVAPIMQACGGTPSPTAAPAKPTEAPKPSAPAPTTAPAATTAPASAAATKPAAAEPTKPAAAGAASPAAAATTAPAAGAAPAAAGAPTATPAPSQSVVQAVAAIQKPKSGAKINGKLQILQNQDFHPDHNAFVRLLLEEWGKAQGWAMDISYIAGFQGGSDLNQKLTAMVQAGTPPDLMDHNTDTRPQTFLNVLEPVTDIVADLTKTFGRPNIGFVQAYQHDPQTGSTADKDPWWGVPYYERAGGWYVRADWFKEAGLDPVKELNDTADRARDAAMKISDPDKKRWGWGMTVNRSGDGDTGVNNILFWHGARWQDATGQKVTINSSEAIKAMEWLKETYSDPKWAKALPPGVNAWNDISNNEAMLAGTLGITDNAGTVLAKAYFDKVPFAENILWVKKPKADLGKGPTPMSGGGESLRIIKGSKNKDGNLDTIKFWLSKEVQQQVWKISTAYALPAWANGWEDPIVSGNKISAAYKDVADNKDWNGSGSPGPRTAAIAAVLAGNIGTDMAGEVLQGKAPKDAVASAQSRAVKIFKEYGLKGE